MSNSMKEMMRRFSEVGGSLSRGVFPHDTHYYQEALHRITDESVKTISEQQERIAVLEEKIATLEANQGCACAVSEKKTTKHKGKK